MGKQSARDRVMQVVETKNHHEVDEWLFNCAQKDLLELVRDYDAVLGRVKELERGLRIYAGMRPEKVYNVTGMSDDEVVAELKNNPEMLAKLDGGRLARELLGLPAVLQAGEKV